MSLKTISNFDKQQYLVIESFRKSGEGVKTPVWFVQDGNNLYVTTGKDSGKIKRIRRNPAIKVAPSDMAGKTRGDWFDAEGHILDDPAGLKAKDKLFNKKYGLMKTIFGLFSNRSSQTEVILEIVFKE